MQHSDLLNLLLALAVLALLLVYTAVKVPLVHVLLPLAVASVYVVSSPALGDLHDTGFGQVFVGAYVDCSEHNTEIVSADDEGNDDDDEDGSLTFYDAEDYAEVMESAGIGQGEKGLQKASEEKVGKFIEKVGNVVTSLKLADVKPEMRATPPPEPEHKIARKISVAWVVLGFSLSLQTIHELDETVNDTLRPEPSKSKLIETFNTPESFEERERNMIMLLSESSPWPSIDSFEYDVEEDYGRVLTMGRPGAALGYYESMENTSTSTIEDKSSSSTTSSEAPLMGNPHTGSTTMKKSSSLRKFFTKAKSLSLPSLTRAKDAKVNSGMARARKINSWKRFVL